jgi:hypothetical protein
MDEGRKRVLLIAASILAARKLAQYDGGKRVPATVAAISDTVRWAEEIMRAIDERSLSDYEAADIPPRHIHKAITLCVIYGLHFSTFLTSIGLDLDEAGRDPIPDNLVPREIPTGFRDDNNKTDEPTGNGFLQQLLNRTQPVPFFLRESLCDLSGVRSPSLHDFFWVGGELNPLHPVLVNGLLVIVNRHRKKLIYSRSRPLWQQPLYMLLSATEHMCVDAAALRTASWSSIRTRKTINDRSACGTTTMPR